MNPVNGDPVTINPVDSDPVKVGPVNGDPVVGDPVDGDPVDGDPVDGDPVVPARPWRESSVVRLYVEWAVLEQKFRPNLFFILIPRQLTNVTGFPPKAAGMTIFFSRGNDEFISAAGMTNLFQPRE